MRSPTRRLYKVFGDKELAQGHCFPVDEKDTYTSRIVGSEVFLGLLLLHQAKGQEHSTATYEKESREIVQRRLFVSVLPGTGGAKCRHDTISSHRHVIGYRLVVDTAGLRQKACQDVSRSRGNLDSV